MQLLVGGVGGEGVGGAGDGDGSSGGLDLPGGHVIQESTEVLASRPTGHRRHCNEPVLEA